MAEWHDMVPCSEITDKVTEATVKFAERFGEHLGTDDKEKDPKTGREGIVREKLTTNQLRKFFGEVKRQQMKGYDVTDFVLLKPKLAYAVGRTQGKNPKIKDFYKVMSSAIDLVHDNDSFKRFIKVFESIVAYHKAAEEKKLN